MNTKFYLAKLVTVRTAQDHGLDRNDVTNYLVNIGNILSSIKFTQRSVMVDGVALYNYVVFKCPECGKRSAGYVPAAGRPGHWDWTCNACGYWEPSHTLQDKDLNATKSIRRAFNNHKRAQKAA